MAAKSKTSSSGSSKAAGPAAPRAVAPEPDAVTAASADTVIADNGIADDGAGENGGAANPPGSGVPGGSPSADAIGDRVVALKEAEADKPEAQDASEGDGIQFVTFDLTRPPSEDERQAFKLLLSHMQRNGVFADPAAVTAAGSLVEDRVALTNALTSIGASEIVLSADSDAQLLTQTADPIGASPADPLPPSLQFSPKDAQFGKDYPLLLAAWLKWDKNPTGWWPRLRIAAKVDGFRRAGLAHSKEPATYGLIDIMRHGVRLADIEAMLAEPNLTVELI